MSTCTNGVGTCSNHEAELTVGNRREYRNSIRVLILNRVGKTACLVGTHINASSKESEFTNRLNTREKSLCLRICDLGVSRVKLTLQLLDLILKSLCLLCDTADVGRLKLSCSIVNKCISLSKKLQHAIACGTLNTSYACCNRGLGNNLEQTDITRVGNVSTATKLGGGGADLNNSYLRAVLLTEECHSTHLLCLVGSGNDSFTSLGGEDINVYKMLYLLDLLLGHSSKVSEVEANSVLVNVGARLLNVSAKHLTESRLEKMSRRVISLNCLTASRVNPKLYLIANLKRAVLKLALVKVNAVCLLRINNGKLGIAENDNTDVTNLATALAVKYGLVGNYSTFALGDRLYSLVINEDRENLTLAHNLCIAEELGCGKVFKQGLGGVRPAGDITSCCSCTLLLLVHQSLEGILVNR